MSILQILQDRFAQVTFTFQQITMQTTPQEEPKSEIEDSHMDYYSSDDHSSNSGEEADHLN